MRQDKNAPAARVAVGLVLLSVSLAAFGALFYVVTMHVLPTEKDTFIAAASLAFTAVLALVSAVKQLVRRTAPVGDRATQKMTRGIHVSKPLDDFPESRQTIADRPDATSSEYDDREDYDAAAHNADENDDDDEDLGTGNGPDEENSDEDATASQEEDNGDYCDDCGEDDECAAHLKERIGAALITYDAESDTYLLPKGRKYVSHSWLNDFDEIRFVTRLMRAGESPETYEVIDISVNDDEPTEFFLIREQAREEESH